MAEAEKLQESWDSLTRDNIAPGMRAAADQLGIAEEELPATACGSRQHRPGK